MDSTNNDFERLLKSYSVYYDINTENVTKPFLAEAVFHSNNEQYFLTKRAPISSSEIHEYVYFVQVENLDLKTLEYLIDQSWNAGLGQIKPSSTHKNSDIVLIILTKGIDSIVKQFIKKHKLSKSYKFSFHGWSDFRLIVKDQLKNELIFNKGAQNYKKLYYKIFGM